VTGSRIRVEAPVGSPITALNQTDITQSGRTTIEDAIRQLPQVFDLGVSENSRGQSGGSGNITYGNSVNLRGIGPNATLILIDSHRVTNNGRSTDPSVLPTLGVERIEVVADGASAIYGSDAIAGVVNLIPRRSLNGVEAFARFGVSDDGVYTEKSAGVAAGHKWANGQIMVAYEHVDKSSLNGLDRPFFTSNQTGSGGNNYSVTRCDPGTIRATQGGTTTSYAIPRGGVTQAGAGSLVGGTSNTCDDLRGQDLIPRQRYDSANATFTYDVTDWLSVFADGFYSYRSFVRLPAYANATVTIPQTNAFFVRPPGFTGTSYLLDYNFGNEVGRNNNPGHSESWQITPGIRVKLPGDFRLEALLDKGMTYDNSITLNGINNAALNAAAASSNPATALDPYGLHRTSAATLAGIFNQIFIAPTTGHFTGYEANVNGTLFNLPGGGVKIAAGYEGQEFKVDLGSARGNPGTATVYTHPSRRVDSGYAELYVPIFGPDNATRFFQRLDIDAAFRYDRYSDVGATTNPKVGVNWEPFDGIKLRGSYGTSFRAPTLPQIYGNSSALFVQNYQNPASGAPIVGVALSGGNLGLKPETATTYSFGTDLEPIHGLKLAATYFSVDYKNQVIALLSDLSVLTRLSQYAGTGLILTGPAAAAQVASLIAQGMTVNGALPGGSAANVTTFVDGRSQNLGRSITRGIDFQATYTLPTPSLGEFAFNLSGTYLTKYSTQQSPAAPFVNQLNQIFQPLRFKTRGQVDWQKGILDVLVRATHIGGYTNTAVTPLQQVASYTPVDLIVSAKVGNQDRPVVLSVEVRDLLDVSPPYVNIAPSVNGSGGYDATTTDPVGRLVAVSARIKL
ncbi:MAG: TonB-dependent receptor plug domain-containing protein, partial [Janthinobacterium lividum]